MADRRDGQADVAHNQRPAAHQINAAPIATAQLERLTKRQVVGFLGAALLFVGVFLPLLSGPFGMELNYFANGQGDGIFVLVLAAASAALVYTRRFRLLWATGAATAGMLIWTFLQLRSAIQDVQGIGGTGHDDPLGIAELVASTVQMRWGWAVLVAGAALTLTSAAMRKS